MLNYSSNFGHLHFCKDLYSLSLYIIFVALVFLALFLEMNYTEVNVAQCQDNFKVQKKPELNKQLIDINIDIFFHMYYYSFFAIFFLL